MARFYWLKLKRDFFKRHDIRIIEEMDNGKDYILFYLKLLVESIDHEGELRFSDTVPYNDKMLSTITNTNIDIVRSAIKIFSELHLMEIENNGTIYMQELQKMLGSESISAERVRKHRALHCNTDVTKCNLEIDIDKEKDIDISNRLKNLSTSVNNSVENSIPKKLYVDINVLIAQGKKTKEDVIPELITKYSEHHINEAWEQVQWHLNNKKTKKKY